MKVLLTGHQGYIGTRLTPLLLDRGHSVTGLDTDLYQGCTFGDGVPEIPSLRCDIRDVTAEHVGGFDAVIHLAGLSNDPLGDYDPALTAAVNEKASRRLGEIARDVGVERFLFASSCSVYGAAGEEFVDERRATVPVTSYGRSKADAERSIAALAGPRFSPTFLRVSTAYGLYPRMRFDLVVNRLLGWAFTTGEIPLHGDGSAWRPLVHVVDIGRAFVAALEAPRHLVHARALNVGSTSENYQVRELALMVSQTIPGSRVIQIAGNGPDRRSYRVDCNLISRVLHEFKPLWTVRHGIEELYAGFHAAGLTIGDLKSPRFDRIAHVRELMDTGELDHSLRWTARVGLAP